EKRSAQVMALYVYSQRLDRRERFLDSSASLLQIAAIALETSNVREDSRLGVAIAALAAHPEPFVEVADRLLNVAVVEVEDAGVVQRRDKVSQPSSISKNRKRLVVVLGRLLFVSEMLVTVCDAVERGCFSFLIVDLPSDRKQLQFDIELGLVVSE